MKHSKKRKKQDDLELDFSKIKNFFKGIGKNKKLMSYSWIILLIIPILLAAHFRLYPSDLPATEDWAKNSIHSQIRNNIDSQISAQYPNLPAANKQNMINENFNNYIQENEQQIEDSIKANAEYFKQQFKNENGETYLLAIDPYTYYRQTKNLVETGHAWDVEINGTAYNDHMKAPLGQPVNKKFNGAGFHVWFSAIWHKFISIFNKDISVMGSFFYVPVIISALSVIPAFFLARRVSGNLGGFFAAMIVGLHQAFLGRTAGGFSDTDAYNVLFPLLISWLFIEAYYHKDTVKKIVYTGLAGLATGLYSFAWTGWWYIFDFALAGMVGYSLYYLILNRDKLKKGIKRYFSIEEIKSSLIILGTFILSSGIFISFFSSFATFYRAPLSPFSALSIQDSARADLWPNVYTTVAELNSASLTSIINGIGGNIFFTIALLGIGMTLMRKNRFKSNVAMIFGSAIWISILIWLQAQLSLLMFIILLLIPIGATLIYYLYKKEQNINVIYAIFFTLWFLGTIYTTTKGIRFLLLLVPVYGVAFGIAIGKIHQYVVEYAHRELELSKKIGSIITAIFLLMLLITPLNSAQTTATNEIPSMNDGWYNTLKKIDNEASEDAIINSWWDFGHWFKAIGDRAVTFDGASQNTPMAHWIGRTLLTGNEKEAIGILRMLDCGSNNAFEKLKESGFSTVESTDILYEIVLTKTDNEARDILEDYDLDQDTQDELIELTHCNAPENYYITSQDMVSKSGVWAHFGSWNFRRALIWNELKTLPKNEFDQKTAELGYTQSESTEIYYEIQGLVEGRAANTWIAPWPSYASSQGGCTETDEEIICSSRLCIQTNAQNQCVHQIEKEITNKTTMETKFITNLDYELIPVSLSYVENGSFFVKEFENSSIEMSISLIPSGNTYTSIIMNPALTDSMFNRLFYYEGVGLEHFDKFNDVRDVTGARILTWKVDWDGKE